MEHRKSTKSEKEYVKALIQTLSLQRLTDQEIVEYLHNEKQIEIGRSTVTEIRNRVEKQAAKWYLELKQSTNKYIAAYKQRIDSLLSYQKKLHEIISSTNKDEVKIRAISELHSIELDIFNLWQQLPNLDITEQSDQQQREGQEQEEKSQYVNIHNVMPEDRDSIIPPVVCHCTGGQEGHYACGQCLHSWCSQNKRSYGDKKEPVKCPRCQTEVYNPNTAWV